MSAADIADGLQRAREAALERRERAKLRDAWRLYDMIVRLTPPPRLVTLAPRSCNDLLDLQRLLFKAAVVLERGVMGEAA